jgi:hypothetical protein
LSDIFARTGGDKTDNSATIFLTILSDNVIIDHTWLWRADHGIDGVPVRDRSVRADHALIVYGDNVIAYGLFAEHTLNDMVIWFGEGGRVYFYQSEFPYD